MVGWGGRVGVGGAGAHFSIQLKPKPSWTIFGLLVDFLLVNFEGGCSCCSC